LRDAAYLEQLHEDFMTLCDNNPGMSEEEAKIAVGYPIGDDA
jgi:hypothetical protein